MVIKLIKEETVSNWRRVAELLTQIKCFMRIIMPIHRSWDHYHTLVDLPQFVYEYEYIVNHNCESLCIYFVIVVKVLWPCWQGRLLGGQYLERSCERLYWVLVYRSWNKYHNVEGYKMPTRKGYPKTFCQSVRKNPIYIYIYSIYISLLMSNGQPFPKILSGLKVCTAKKEMC